MVRVLQILRDVSDHTVDHRGLIQLIELTQSFAHSYLKYHYKNFSHTLLAEDNTINEMAIDAIAFLFEQDDTGRLIQIKKAFEHWTPEIKTEAEALFFVNRLAAKCSEKYLTELLKESNPLFSKIHRSINYLIEANGYKKKQIFGTTYIIDGEDLNIGSLPETQFIYDLPVKLFNSTHNFLQNIFNYIKDSTNNTSAIPLNALVIKIQRVGMAEIELNESIPAGNVFEIESLANSALAATFKKLEIGYFNKNKINEKESEAIKNALRQIAIDLQDGGIITGLHKYLMEEITLLSFEDYKEKYQNIFEYLYKVLKKEIVFHLEESN